MKTITILITLCFALNFAYAQNQTTNGKKPVANEKLPKIEIQKDSSAIADSIRRRATRRVTRHSAILPGWGQVDNNQVWKVPIIYGALGVTTYLFFDNLNSYKSLRAAYILRTDTIPGNDNEIPEEYRPLSDNSIKFYRDEYRKNVDYSALAFLILWGLNVVDATVFANLREFDVSDKLSLRIKTPGFNPFLGTGNVGVTLNLKPETKHLKPLPAR